MTTIKRGGETEAQWPLKAGTQAPLYHKHCHRLSSRLGRLQRLLTPHSRSSIPSFPQRPVYALQALRLCHLGDILDHQGPVGLANDGLSPWKREGWQTEQRPRAGQGVSQSGRVNTKLMETAPLWEGQAGSRA
ncbi:unnamed protein product [Tetraodon nigroviridis]|uniref:(spotted green pufferfish) hypothetical protein n=1 Tax=Tetraodon nigroviridis TaxID=99883 RepID=Q4SLJ1_TETNG|nr:unnamed protein product [Tetraodon nigroviridis]